MLMQHQSQCSICANVSNFAQTEKHLETNAQMHAILWIVSSGRLYQIALQLFSDPLRSVVLVSAY